MILAIRRMPDLVGARLSRIDLLQFRTRHPRQRDRKRSSVPRGFREYRLCEAHYNHFQHRLVEQHGGELIYDTGV